MQTSQPLDFVTVAVAFATLLFGHDMAVYIGPYSVIVVGAALGGVISASRRASNSNFAVVGHIFIVVSMALLFTVPAAEYVARYAGIKDARVLFGPVAAVIAGIGPDWPAVGRWALNLARSVIERRVGAQPPNDPPPPGGTP